ncbi:MAG: hypothetical protein ABJ205_07355 [Erythrobacter sp.]|uniref:hypothetical protein n=1 Tax=Erythrobacter sp. TaxID=1042 RepID=UPI0032647623
MTSYRLALASLACITLTGCHILFPEDPREGTELSEECPTRFSSLLDPTTQFAHAFNPTIGEDR